MRKLQAAGLVSVLSLSLALGACGSDENTITDQTAQAVGVTLAAEVSGMPASFTATSVAGGSVGGGFFAPRAFGLAHWAAPGFRPNLVNQACNPTVDDPTDADQDGVPDDATFTFSQANCTTGNFYITGLVHIIDPSPTAVGYGGTFTNFLAYIAGTGGDFFSIELDGSHGVLGTPTTAKLSENLTTQVDGQSGSQTLHGTLTNIWDIDFAAAVGQTIVMDDVLPDGDFDINGGFVYDINGERVSFTVRTETALAYDSSCVLEHPFSAGQLRAHVGGPNGQVYVQVTYTGCGIDPSVVLIGRNS